MSCARDFWIRLFWALCASLVVTACSRVSSNISAEDERYLSEFADHFRKGYGVEIEGDSTAYSFIWSHTVGLCFFGSAPDETVRSALDALERLVEDIGMRPRVSHARAPKDCPDDTDIYTQIHDELPDLADFERDVNEMMHAARVFPEVTVQYAPWGASDMFVDGNKSVRYTRFYQVADIPPTEDRTVPDAFAGAIALQEMYQSLTNGRDIVLPNPESGSSTFVARSLLEEVGVVEEGYWERYEERPISRFLDKNPIGLCEFDVLSLHVLYGARRRPDAYAVERLLRRAEEDFPEILKKIESEDYLEGYGDAIDRRCWRDLTS